MFDIRRAENGTVMLSGRLDASQAEKARGVLATITESCAIDFTDLDYISSLGLGVLLEAQKRLNEVPPAITKIREAGMPAGIAGHNPKVFEWAEEHLDVDFYLCSYYNSAHRDKQAEHVSGRPEWFHAADRDAMVKVIQELSRPVIHYKVLAAGRNDPEEAFTFVAKHLRPQDAVCVGIYTKGHPTMLEENVALLEACLRRVVC